MTLPKRFVLDIPPRAGNVAGTGATAAPPPQASAPSGAPAPRADASPGSARGMKAVILNWKAGENDPFTVVNAAIRQHFHECGKDVETIEISDDAWPRRLAQQPPGSIEFAFTWQGLGSRARADGGASLWDALRIPLLCVHGDHPSHMPPNHELESRYCFHLYNNAEFARYSNRYFRRLRSAAVVDIPQLHREPRRPSRAGDHFVMAKNIHDPLVTESKWREGMLKPVFDIFMSAAESVKARLARGAYFDIHDALDEFIAAQGLDWMRGEVNLDVHHEYHRELDFYLRSYRSVTAIEAVREFPVRVYGRGWDRVAQSASKHHVFEAGRNMADSQDFYYSRFGLVDVSPSRGLHDRTRRAMANGTGFLSSANLEETLADARHFDALFFNFAPGDLAQRCAAVMREPDAHQALAQRFADRYHDRFHFRAFVERLEQMAKSVRTAAWPS